MTKRTVLENKAIRFAHHTFGNITMLRRLDEGELVHEIHKAYKSMVNAIEKGTGVEKYRTCVHMAAVAGKYGIRFGDQVEAASEAVAASQSQGGGTHS